LPSHHVPAPQLIAQVAEQLLVDGSQVPPAQSASLRQRTQVEWSTVPSVLQKGVSPGQAAQRAPQWRSVEQLSHCPVMQ
jgi:hypothetical protein